MTTPNESTKDTCCESLREAVEAMKDLILPVGSGEVSGSVSLNSEGISLSDGWNHLPEIPFNYCPWCGTPQPRIRVEGNPKESGLYWFSYKAKGYPVTLAEFFISEGFDPKDFEPKRGRPLTWFAQTIGREDTFNPICAWHVKVPAPK